MELFVDALLDALVDGVKMLPFLYLAYLLIEWLERHHGESIEGALAGGEKQQQAQRGGRSLGRRAYMEEQQQVCQQQQIQLGAGVHAERHATIPAFSKCFFIMRWPNSPPSTAQTKIAAIAATKLPLLMGANSVSM